jgi:hypothetical protein
MFCSGASVVTAGIAPAKELVLIMATAKLLREHCLPDWKHTHFPAGELRDKRTAAKLKQMGLTRHWPDFILINGVGYLHCLEVKRVGEDLDDGQEEFREWCIGHCVPYCVAWTLDDVCMIMDEWGCLRIKFRPD